MARNDYQVLRYLSVKLYIMSVGIVVYEDRQLAYCVNYRARS